MSQLADISPVLTESPERADEDAATLYDCYGPRIREYCYGQLRDRVEADDAVQSTFLYAFTLLRRGETPRKPLPWLYTIAHNVCRTRRRALKRRSKVESSVALDAVEETVGRNDPSHEDLAHLASSLAALPLSQRTALLLREWQGLSYGEIAVELGLTESAVEAVLFRARRNLAKKLQYVSDRAATIAGAVLLLPSLRRLSSFGPTARTAAATAVLVGTTALVPFADTPHASSADTAPQSPPTVHESPLTPLRADVTRAQATRTPRFEPLGHVTVVTGAEAAAVPAAATADARTTPAPTTSAAPAASTPAAAAATPKPVRQAVDTAVDSTGKALSAAQTTVGSVESTVPSTADTVTTGVSSVTSQVATTVPQLPTVTSPLQPPPENTPLPGLP